MNEPDPVVGMALALQVADHLESGKVLADSHRDFCGTGLCFVKGKYIHGQVWDGMISPESLFGQFDEEMEIKIFKERNAFVVWLAVQSDESLSGKHLPKEWMRNNGRITIKRLKQFVNESDELHRQNPPIFPFE